MELHYDFMLRLLIAGAMGVCIGVEREYLSLIHI